MGNSRTQNNLQHFQFKDTLVYIVLTNVHLGLQANNPQKGLHIYIFYAKGSSPKNSASFALPPAVFEFQAILRQVHQVTSHLEDF